MKKKQGKAYAYEGFEIMYHRHQMRRKMIWILGVIILIPYSCMYYLWLLNYGVPAADRPYFVAWVKSIFLFFVPKATICLSTDPYSCMSPSEVFYMYRDQFASMFAQYALQYAFYYVIACIIAIPIFVLLFKRVSAKLNRQEVLRGPEYTAPVVLAKKIKKQ